MKWLPRARNDMAALTRASVVIVRRGLLAAVATLLVTGPIAIAVVVAAAHCGAPGRAAAFFLAPVAAATLYSGPLAAFAIALRRRATVGDTLRRGTSSIPGLALICVPAAFMAFGLFMACTFIVSPFVPGGRGSDAVGTLVQCTVGIFALGIVLREWSGHFLLPAAILMVEVTSVRDAYNRSALLAKRRLLVFSVAAAFPFVFLLAAIPDPMSQSAALQLLDARGVVILRVVVGTGAAVASLFACAALSVAAYGLATKQLETEEDPGVCAPPPPRF